MTGAPLTREQVAERLKDGRKSVILRLRGAHYDLTPKWLKSLEGEFVVASETKHELILVHRQVEAARK